MSVLERISLLEDTIKCEAKEQEIENGNQPIPLSIAELNDGVRHNAKQFPSSGGGTRTTRIFPGKNVHLVKSWGRTGDN